MKKYLFAMLSLLLFNVAIDAQRFGNEWINYGQPYLKMAVNTSGIYRITKANLDASSFDVFSKNVTNFQVFHRGNEIAINLVDINSNGAFDADDYIEFYAMNNDGFQDSELYLINHARPHPYVSIYSNETAYFLTITPNVIGKRMPAGPSIDTGITIDPYYMASILTFPPLEHSQDGNRPTSPVEQQAYFEPHEGLTGPIIGTAGTYNVNIPLPNYQPLHNNDHTTVEGMVQSRMPYSKTLNYSIGGTNTGSIALNYLLTAPFSTTLPTVTSPVNITISWAPNPISTDLFSMSYHKITYPSNFVYLADNEYGILSNSGNKSRINFTGGAPTIGYDITSFANQKKITISGNDVYIDNTNQTRKIYLASTNRTPVSFKKLTFTKIVQTDYDYILLTDPSLRPAADDYANYRKSAAGGAYKVLLKEVRGPVETSIYEEFCYGERNPIAIRRFADYMTEEGGKPKALFLCGNSYSFVSGLKLANRDPQDYVPTFGYPGSDVLLTSGLTKGNTTNPLSVPLIPTGRLAAINPQDVTNYLSKVTAFEAQTNFLWQKNLIHMTGAKHDTEKISMKTKMDNLNAIAVASSFGFKPQIFYEKIGTTDAELDAQQEASTAFANSVNAGAGIINYLGHGNFSAMSHNIGFLTDPDGPGLPPSNIQVAGQPYKSLRSTNPISGKFPFLMANGCGVGNSFTGLRDCIVSNWVKNDTTGAIAAYSQSFYSYDDVDYKYMDLFYRTYLGNQTNVLNSSKQLKTGSSNSQLGKTIGEVIQQTNKNYLVVYAADIAIDPRLTPNLEQGILHADPGLVIFKANVVLSTSTRLINFTAKNLENKVKLDWNTESESNLQGFEIEKSADLKAFSKLGSIKAIGKENESNAYSFIDEKPMEGLNYYRLKMMENDGSFTFSKPVFIDFADESTGKLIVFSNPVKENFFYFSLKDMANTTAELFDINGNNIKIELFVGTDGKHKVQLLSHKSKGEYIFYVKNKSGKAYTQKLLLN